MQKWRDFSFIVGAVGFLFFCAADQSILEAYQPYDATGATNLSPDDAGIPIVDLDNDKGAFQSVDCGLLITPSAQKKSIDTDSSLASEKALSDSTRSDVVSRSWRNDRRGAIEQSCQSDRAVHRRLLIDCISSRRGSSAAAAGVFERSQLIGGKCGGR